MSKPTDGASQMRWNPILIRELWGLARAESRTGTPIFMGYLIISIIFLGLLYWLGDSKMLHVMVPEALFCFFAATQAISIARPDAVTAGSIIQGERDQNTIHSLMVSPLSATKYANGLLGLAAYRFLTRTLPFLPFYAVVFLMGGFTLKLFAFFQVGLLIHRLAFECLALSMAVTVFSPEAMELRMKRLSQKGVGTVRIPNASQIAQFQPLTAIIGIIAMLVLWLSVMIPGAQPGAVTAARQMWQFIAALHPLASIAFIGGVDLFGFRIPVSVYVFSVWIVFGLLWYATFVYHFTLRRFRWNASLRLARMATLLFVSALAAGFTWAQPAVGAVLIMSFLAIALTRTAFRVPLMPMLQPEKWGLLPGRQMLVHRAGTLPGYTLAVAGLCMGIQGLLAWHSGSLHLAMAVATLNAMLLLAGLSLILAELIRLMHLEIKAMLRPPVTPEEAAAAVAEAVARGKKPEDKAGQPRANYFYNLAFMFWLVPVPVLVLAPALASTPAAPYAKVARMVIEPLLYLNPAAFAIRYFQMQAPGQNPEFTTDYGPPVLPQFGIPLDFFRLSLIAWAIVLVMLVAVYRRKARRYQRTWEETAPTAPAA